MGHHAGDDTVKPQLIGLADVATGGTVAGGAGTDAVPRLYGIPLKYISLFTLAVQNASLTIVMHHSRVSIPSSQMYSAASAVLLNELLKGLISLAVAYSRVDEHATRISNTPHRKPTLHVQPNRTSTSAPSIIMSRCKKLGKEIFSPDCWKLSIPAILYVIQNNLQFVAASNLQAATFQVSYQMKILTTAAFSVLLLRRRLSTAKWLSLVALAVGVGIVQIQSSPKSSASHHHEMHPLKGLMAVVAACFTSGLAGVYFEMVLKGSQVDLWVRNVQLSLFSLLPALVPILATGTSAGAGHAPWFMRLFVNFGAWAWITVAIQVLGGLVTAIVIKHADNILKGFATSLSIVISSLASVALFGFEITPAFVLGSSTVLGATFLYNKPETDGAAVTAMPLPKLVTGVITPRKSSYPGTPVEPDAPILGEYDRDKKRLSGVDGGASPRMLAAALRLVNAGRSEESLAGHNETLSLSADPGGSLSRNTSSSSLSMSAYALPPPYYSHPHSRSHSPVPAHVHGLSGPPNRVHLGSPLAVPVIDSRVGHGHGKAETGAH